MSKALLALFALALVMKANATPLDDYVNAPDSHFSYSMIKTYEMTGYKLYVLNMTSQKWLDETLVKNPIWWHYLVITIPDKITRPDAGLLLIDGGSNTDGYKRDNPKKSKNNKYLYDLNPKESLNQPIISSS
jgi:PhoPQ-activated pathogenicity-related protein